MRILLLASGIALSGAISAGATEHARPSPQGSPPTISSIQAARLAKQATFGPTPDLIREIVSSGSAEIWIESQFEYKNSKYSDLARYPVAANYCDGKSGTDRTACWNMYSSSLPVAMRFYSNAIENKDQLRQRVAFALSQILVTSDQGVHSSAGLAAYNQILLDNAFGNYRDILLDVTLNPYMGDYLNVSDSTKTSPNENYAREIAQLFTMGTIKLDPQGAPLLDDKGDTIANYGPTDIREMARALTGWTPARLDNAPISNWAKRDYTRPMIKVADRFDTGEKSFLGKTIPAGASQEDNIRALIDATFYNPSTPPFISKRLIQQLVTSNPSKEYVGRVSAVFSDNGSGVRGDLKAVVRAILLDEEARNVRPTGGKVKEPILYMTSIARAIDMKGDGLALYYRENALGQPAFRAPSVFNFYSASFPLAQSRGLVSPPSQLMNTSTLIARHNLAIDWTLGSSLKRSEFQKQATIPGSTGTKIDWSTWSSAAADTRKLVDRVDLVLLNGAMTPAQRTALSKAINATKRPDPAIQRRLRAQTALYIVFTSPMFQVDR